MRTDAYDVVVVGGGAAILAAVGLATAAVGLVGWARNRRVAAA
jgi:hypothetical protein